MTDDTSRNSDTVLGMVNETCDRFEQAWRSGQAPRLAAWLEQLSPDLRKSAFFELLKLDLDYRTRDSEYPTKEDYLPQFEECEAEIKRAFTWLYDESGNLPSIPGYVVNEKIGQGGMGVVYRATQLELRRELAVKVLGSEISMEPSALGRFADESIISSQLNHPSIVPIHAIGKLEDDRPFLTMKLVQGETLAALLAARKSTHESINHVLQVFQAICQAIAYAHSQRVIHRDLKPQNVMIGEFGEVQVMDWGLAKRLALDSASETEVGNASGLDHVSALADSGTDRLRTMGELGTFSYMPPEQARAEVASVDMRSDVFSLGAILCEILTGQPVYVHADPADVARQAKQADLSAASARLNDCGHDPALIELAISCLAVRREDRPQDGREVARRITNHLEQIQENLRQAELERSEAKAREVEERKRRRQQLIFASSALIVVLMGSLAALWYLQERSNLAIKSTQTQARAVAYMDKATETLDALTQKTNDSIAISSLLGDVSSWEQSILSAEQNFASARDLVDSMEILDADLSNQAAELEERIAGHQRSLRIAQELDRIRMLPTARVNSTRDAVLANVCAKYVQFFLNEFKIDFAAEPAESIASAISASKAKHAIIAALDHWSFAAEFGLEADQELLPKILTVARLADPDPSWRDKFRTLEYRSDKQKLTALAKHAAYAKQSPQIQCAFSRLLIRHKEGNLARDMLLSAARLHPKDFWVHFHLSKFSPDRYGRLGHAHTVLSIGSDNSIAWVNLGQALESVAEWGDAISAYKNATALNPHDAEAWARLANRLRRRGARVDANQTVRKGLRFNPDSATLFSLRGAHEYYDGEVDASIHSLQEANRLDPFLVEARLNLAQFLLFEGRFSAASKVLEQFDERIQFANDDQQKAARGFRQACKQGIALQTREKSQPVVEVSDSWEVDDTLASEAPRDCLPTTLANLRQAYRLRLRAGQHYRIDLQSSEFKPLVRVENDQHRTLLTGRSSLDEDSRIGRKSRRSWVVFKPTEDAIFRAVVTSNSVGAYSLQVSAIDPPSRSALLDGEITPANREEEGKYYRDHEYLFDAGKDYVIRLRSEQFDTAVELRNGFGPMAKNDDGAPGRIFESRIDYAPRSKRSGQLRVTTSEVGQFGAYTLQIDEFSDSADQDSP